MPAFCSCGAQLPADALFCHRCGKPQRELPVVAPEPEAAIPPPAAATAPPPGPLEIGFANRSAVNIAMITAGAASILMSIQMGVLTGFWIIVLLVASGFLAVYVYHRRWRVHLSVRSGARLGWITGVFCFLIAMVLFTINIAALSSKGGLAAFYREQLQARAAAGASVQDALRVLDSPAGMTLLIVLTLLFAFVMFTVLPMVGGALGAKVTEKE